MTDLFDAYGRRAWLQPGLIVALPISLAAVALVASAPGWWQAASAVLIASGVTVLAASAIRQHGQQLQGSLWEEWGGAPTTQRLRWRGNDNAELVARRHRHLTRLFPDQPLPTAAEEAADPGAADRVYETVVGALRERTRDTDAFPRVAAENADYGFRRNLLACRTVGICVASTGLLLAAVALGARVQGHAPWVSPLALAFLVVADGALVLAYSVVVRRAWVRAAAEAYADRLLGALELIPAPQAP
jgi:hypothetical protein